MFCYATPGAAEDAVGPGFIEDEAEFVPKFKFDLGIVVSVIRTQDYEEQRLSAEEDTQL